MPCLNHWRFELHPFFVASKILSLIFSQVDKGFFVYSTLQRLAALFFHLPLPLIIVTRNEKIVWKLGPNRLFYPRMFRTKLHLNIFFFTGHQNVNKPKSRTARTVYGLIFLPFYEIIVSFFFFFMSRCKQNKVKLLYNCNLSKKHELTLYKTQKFFFNFYQELPNYAKPWGQTSKYYRTA